MQWIGALLLILSTTSIGIYKSVNLDKRPKHIRQLIQSLQLLEAEITYSQAALQDAFQRISRVLPLPMSKFFGQLSQNMKDDSSSFVTTWCDSVDHLYKISSLQNRELEVIKQFGRSLGQHDYVQQQKQIQLALTHLERELAEAYDEQKKYGQLSKSLGLLSGIFIVLLLI